MCRTAEHLLDVQTVFPHGKEVYDAEAGSGLLGAVAQREFNGYTSDRRTPLQLSLPGYVK